MPDFQLVPVDHIPEFPDVAASAAGLPQRPSGPQQWESAIQEQQQRDLRKPSMGEQVADILGKTAQVAGAPILSLSERMRNAFEHGIDWGNTEQLKQTTGGTLLDMMGLAGGSAIPRVARTGGADTTLGMFFAAPAAAAKQAEKMLAAGADAKGVWNKLGIFQGKDGHWRTEATGPSSMRPGWQPGDLLPQAVDQPHVYANEPAAKQVFMDQMTTSPNSRAEYFPYDKRYQTPADAQIAVAPGGVGKPGELEDIQHETQHFLQNHYGWSSHMDTADPSLPAFNERYLRAADKIDPSGNMNLTSEQHQWAMRRADWETYHQSASEVEARNSAAREAKWREISAAQGPQAAEKWRVENPPWTTEDVPREQQHVSYGQQGYGSSAVKTPPAMMDAARKAAPWAKAEETAAASTPRLHPDQQRELIQSLYGDAAAERDAAQRAAGANWTHEMEKEQGVWLVKDPAERKRMGLPEIPVPPPPAAPIEAAPAAPRGWLSSLIDRAQPAAEAAPLKGKPPISRAEKSPAIYNAPARPLRPFEADYPRGTGSDEIQISHDIEGRPLSAPLVAGRRLAGGEDIAIRPGEYDRVAQAATGNPTEYSARNGMGGNFGRTFIDRRTGKPTLVEIAKGMPDETADRVYAHEVGHVIDELAGQIDTKGLSGELKEVYNTLNNPNRLHNNPSEPANWGKPFTPQALDYFGEEVPREHMAEAVRAYMTNPNYLKTEAPKTAARIREFVNKHPELSKIIQFNMLPIAAGVGGGFRLIPVDHDPFAEQRQ